MKLIDADALYNGAMKNEYFQFKESDKTGREAFAYSCAMERLVEAPAVDAAPVVHGRWVDENPSDYTDVRMRCSVCKRIDTPLANWDYCPHCGAKMDAYAPTCGPDYCEIGGGDDES